MSLFKSIKELIDEEDIAVKELRKFKQDHPNMCVYGNASYMYLLGRVSYSRECIERKLKYRPDHDQSNFR